MGTTDPASSNPSDSRAGLAARGRAGVCWRRILATSGGISNGGGAPLATIVLADDDDDLRTVYAIGLKMAGHAVHEAANGHEALATVRAHRPEMLLLDIWMPAMNGFEVLDALRHDPAGARLRILVVSNLADADARLEAFEAGASDYVVKGLALADLIARVDRALAAAIVTPELD